MLKIRLTRMGKKHQPHYRIVVTPKENPAQGQYLDLLGTYNPLKEDVSINTERALEWLNKGAQPSDRVARLLTTAGVSHRSIVVKTYQPKPKEEPKAEAEAPANIAEEVADESAAEVTEETPSTDEPTPES